MLSPLTRSDLSEAQIKTCHQIKVNSDGDNDHPDTNPADRLAVAWYKIYADDISIAESGRFYDVPGDRDERKHYFMPSIDANKNGDFVIGFSGSGIYDYVSAFYAGRRNGGAPSQPVRFFAGKDWCDDNGDGVHLMRWGDYSHTSLDPDGLTIWSIQEYAETRYLTGQRNAYGTRIVAVTAY